MNCAGKMMVEFSQSNFRHCLQGAKLKRHGMLRDNICRLAELDRRLIFPSAATILARRSRSASASLAIARCMFSGSVMSLISTAVTWVPRARVLLVDDVLDLIIDARGIRQQLIETEPSDHIGRTVVWLIWLIAL